LRSWGVFLNNRSKYNLSLNRMITPQADKTRRLGNYFLRDFDDGTLPFENANEWHKLDIVNRIDLGYRGGIRTYLKNNLSAQDSVAKRFKMLTYCVYAPLFHNLAPCPEP
jgi:hypothetical protein